MKVWLETIPTLRYGVEVGVKQRWVAEVGDPSDTWAELGHGRTRREAIANLGPRAYAMDFDSVAWKTRVLMGA